MQPFAPDGTRLERTGWRCQDISERHRAWGVDCPAVDMDFVLLEYNHGKPVALIEYKHDNAREPNLKHATYRALADLAGNYASGALPFYVVFYEPGAWWFRVFPVNERAKELCSEPGAPITEQQFVKGLYLLRKKVLSKYDLEIIARLSDVLPASRGSAAA
jgi:hypothetical protein